MFTRRDFIKMAEAADVDPSLELLSSKREIQKRIRENTTLPIAGGAVNRLAEESMIVADGMQYIDSQQTGTIDFAIMDINVVHPELFAHQKQTRRDYTSCTITAAV